MSMLGRRKHSRYLLAQPIDGNVRLRDEVMIEAIDEHEITVLAAEACRPDERVSLEIPGGSRSRVHARVADSRPEVAEDGAIRHRIRLVPSSPGGVAAPPLEESR
jgi:hypothetical protein